MNNDVQILEETAASTARFNLTSGQRVGVIVVASILTAGIAAGIVVGVKKFREYRAAKKASQESSESHD